MGKLIYCPHCIKQNSETATQCQYCGKELQIENDMPALPVGTMLADRYYVGKALRKGGFGITYIGCDTRLNKIVAIKEYFPSAFAARLSEDSQLVTISGENAQKLFEQEKEKFITEAYTLAEFAGERNIVSVTDILSENDTVYLVMEFVDGADLDQYIESHPRMSFKNAFRMLAPVIMAMERVHKKGLIHRDITPANIKILSDNTAVLLDFGAAREFEETDESGKTVILKPGFAPPEQYQSHGAQGPWTDVYGLCATMYKMLTGITPVNSIDRMADDTLEPPSALGCEINEREEAALLHGLAVQKSDRTPSMKAFYEEVTGVRLPSSDEKTEILPDATEILSDEYMTEYAPGQAKQGDKNKSKRILIASVAAGVVVLLLLGVVIGGNMLRGGGAGEASSELEASTDGAGDLEGSEAVDELGAASDVGSGGLTEKPLTEQELVMIGSDLLLVGEDTCFFIDGDDGRIDLSDYDVEWHSSNAEVAEAADGVITGVSVGVVTISATIEGIEVSKQLYVAAVDGSSEAELETSPDAVAINPAMTDIEKHNVQVRILDVEENNEDVYAIDYYTSASLEDAVELEWAGSFNGGAILTVSASRVVDGYITVYLLRVEDANVIMASKRIPVIADEGIQNL